MKRFRRHETLDRDSVVIEPLTKRALREVVSIESTAYPTPWTKKVFESELRQVADGTRYYVVARRDGDIVGYAGLWIVDDPDGNQAHVTNIVTASDARRTGVASALLRHLASVAIERGAVAWTLEVRASNAGAQELYRRFGFAPAGIRKRYYDNTEDAIVMWCHDLASTDYLERISR